MKQPSQSRSARKARKVQVRRRETWMPGLAEAEFWKRRRRRGFLP